MLEAYFVFNGRMRRLRLLAYSVLLTVLLAFLVIGGRLALDSARSVAAATLLIQGLFALLWLCAWAAMGVKRLHDLDKSGWHFLWLVLAPQALTLGAGTSGFDLRSGVDARSGLRSRHATCSAASRPGTSRTAIQSLRSSAAYAASMTATDAIASSAVTRRSVSPRIAAQKFSTCAPMHATFL